MRRLLVALGVFAAFTMIVAWLFGFGPPFGIGEVSQADHGGIRSLQLVPYPEGPDSPLFERSPRGDDFSVALSTVEAPIPDPLPAPRWQGAFCDVGGDLVVTFGDGSTLSYGPCKRPREIERLRSAMIAAMSS